MRPLFVLLALASMAQAQTCNRDCLKGFITRYLDAMVAHNPGALPLDPKVRFTEDSVELKVGEGLWKGASKVRPYRQDYIDVRQSNAAAHVVVEENGSPVLLSLRLKIANQKITEIETMTTRGRTDGALFTLDTLQSPNPAMNVVPTAQQRLSREEAIRIAMFYPTGLKAGGAFENVNAPFAPDAYRIENGAATAGGACTREGCKDLRTQKIIAHPALTSRVIAVDEEMGIVLLWMNFGNTGSYGAGNALVVWEAFKVHGGQIHAIEAFMKVMPEKSTPNWN
jgi:hypothetical protein